MVGSMDTSSVELTVSGKALTKVVDLAGKLDIYWDRKMVDL